MRISRVIEHNMKKACIIGWPVKHSRSPLIHRTWLKQYEIAGAYDKEEVNPSAIKDFISALKDHGYCGANVTLPHKEVVLQCADEVDQTAREIGAANTLWYEGGRLCATNTDIYGYMAHLDISAPAWQELDGPVVILGAGGAARAILYGLLQRGVETLRLINRNQSRAEALVEDLAQWFGAATKNKIKIMSWDQCAEGLVDCTLLINTTSLGMSGHNPLDVDLDRVADQAVISDIVYTPLYTPLLKAAQDRGLNSVDGLGMLLHQAVPGFEKWFGHRPQVTPELRALIIQDLEKNP